MSVVLIIVVLAAAALLFFGVSRMKAVIPQLKGRSIEMSVSNRLRRLPEEYCVMDNVVFVSNGGIHADRPYCGVAVWGVCYRDKGVQGAGQVLVMARHPLTAVCPW